MVTETECEGLGGTFHGPGSTCTVSGACCFDADGDGIDESCQVMDELCCEDLGGTLPDDRDRILGVIDRAIDGDVPLRPEEFRGL